MMNMRTLHPLAWWVWGISLAIASSRAESFWLLGVLIFAALVVTFSRKSDDPWSAALTIGIKLALIALTVRMFIAIIFSVPGQGRVLFSIPRIQLPEWLAGIYLGGDITVERLRFVLLESLIIFALVLAIAAASSLANPKQTLRALPGVLHEAGVALIIATTLIPHFVISIRRIKEARGLRGDQEKLGLKKTLVPLFEEALERALILSESMEARGYGHRPAQRSPTASTLLMVIGLGLLLYSVLQLLLGQQYEFLLFSALASLAAGLILANKKSIRSKYRPLPWRNQETFVVIAALFVIAISGFATNYLTVASLSVVALAPLYVTKNHASAP
jgi:energy-coupling factor transport system permease protein